MADTDYTSVPEFKKRIASTQSGSDSWLQQLLNSSAVLVDKKTRAYKPGYEAFTESAPETRYFNDDAQLGWIAIDDCLSVSAVVRAGYTIAANVYKLYPWNPGKGPYTRLYFAADAASPQVLGIGNTFYNYPYQGVGVGQIAITGTWGYCKAADRPSVVEEAVLRQAEKMYEMSLLSPAELATMIVNPAKVLSPDIDLILIPVMRDMTE